VHAQFVLPFAEKLNLNDGFVLTKRAVPGELCATC